MVAEFGGGIEELADGYIGRTSVARAGGVEELPGGPKVVVVEVYGRRHSIVSIPILAAEGREV